MPPSLFTAVLVLATSLSTALPLLVAGTHIDTPALDAARRKRQEAAYQYDAPQWFYMDGDRQVGPLNTSDLVAAADGGAVTLRTNVYHPDTGWRPASEVPELHGIAK